VPPSPLILLCCEEDGRFGFIFLVELGVSFGPIFLKFMLANEF
jgi:hypothetical protein